MPSLKSLEGRTVFGAKGAEIGRVAHVLCHPSKPVVIGFEIQPPNVALVVSRKPRYAAFTAAQIREDRIDLAETADATGERAARALGIEWDDTVIWAGMPVRNESGGHLGFVRDATFRAEDGLITEITLTGGITSDAAVGTRVVLGDLVIGFDGSAVRVADAASDAQFSGGLAAKAGTGAAVAKVVVGDAAKRAAELGGAAAKAAAKSKAARGAWSMLRDTGKAFKDALKDEDAE